MAAVKAVFFLQIILFPVILGSNAPGIQLEMNFHDQELSDAGDSKNGLNEEVREKINKIKKMLAEVSPLAEICGECDSNPCLNGGTWHQEVGGNYSCLCPTDWTGDRCEEIRSPCESNPCLNGGSCTTESRVNYDCQCPFGWIGEKCQERPCDSNPCLHGGSCTNEAGGHYSCQCAFEWIGDRCQETPCDSNPCLNGGSCTNQAGGNYSCKCAIGWNGDRCQEKPCDSNPCLNGGNCTNEAADSYSCQCAIGWVGEICQEINPCNSRPCLNGGNCTSEAGGNYSCQCVIGWLGDQCQSVILNKGLEDSVIVGNNAAQLDKLYGWLDGVTRLGTTQWKLCWRASQDGWAATTFHSMCDHKGPTVTIVKVDQYIFGGYTSTSWTSSSSWRSDSKGFLFSLVNKPGWEPMKLPQPGEQDSSYSYTTYDYYYYGPAFGGAHDLYISSEAGSGTSSYSNLGYSYSPPPGHNYGSSFTQEFLAGGYSFTPDEVEVFYAST